MASFELNEKPTAEANNNTSSNAPLIPTKNPNHSSSHLKFWFILVVLFSACIIGTVFITKAVVENDTSSASSSSSNQTPKNLIVIISDGMGQTYNTAYRLYKKLNETLIDKHFKGRYSTTPTNKWGVTDSAAGATVFASGVPTHNSFLGVDADANPKGTILAAAKRKGKGTGIVCTATVTHATPAAFSAHSLDRGWHEMISKQQATRQINGEPMLDVLFGGGRQYFERWGFFQNESVWHDEYGWNKVMQNGTEFVEHLDDINIDEMPFMGLFAESSYPYYLDRINGDIQMNDTDDGTKYYPDLMEMSEKAINLLSAKYEKEGFFLMVEASEVDWCGHDNDIVCLLWEMEEFILTTEYILNWAEENGDTLVVMLSDHETGGMTVGRDGSFYSDDIVRYWDGTIPRDWNISGAWGSYYNDYSIAPPSSVSSFIEHRGVYKFIPDAIMNSTHTADWFVDETRDGGSITTVDQLYDALETMYLGSDNPKLTPLEKEFISSSFSRSSSTRRKVYTMLMNARTLTGWTTHGHTGSDCAVYAYGPKQDEFIGHFTNYKIGKLLSKVFDVENEQQMETEYVEKLFMNGTLKICDPTDKQNYIEWDQYVEYPEGNLLYPNELCVDEWI